MKIFKLIIRFISLPFLGLAMLAYPEIRINKFHITYTWYRNKEDYDSVLNQSIESEDCKTYLQWKSDAKERIAEYKKSRVPFIKVAIIPNELMSCLRKHDLENSSENREKFAVAIYQSAEKNGIENKI